MQVKRLPLIVDMEHEDAHPSGSRFLAKGDSYAIARLWHKVRQADGSIVHTGSVRKPDALEFTVFNNVIRRIEGRWGAEFIDQLKPKSDEPVVAKYTHDRSLTSAASTFMSRSIVPGNGKRRRSFTRSLVCQLAYCNYVAVTRPDLIQFS